MQDNIIKSIQYVELINNIASILNDLLYSPEYGYTNLSGKDAVLNYDVVVEKFDNEDNFTINDSLIETLKDENEKIISIYDDYENEKRYIILYGVQSGDETKVLEFMNNIVEADLKVCHFYAE